VEDVGRVEVEVDDVGGADRVPAVVAGSAGDGDRPVEDRAGVGPLTHRRVQAVAVTAVRHRVEHPAGPRRIGRVARIGLQLDRIEQRRQDEVEQARLDRLPAARLEQFAGQAALEREHVVVRGAGAQVLGDRGAPSPEGVEQAHEPRLAGPRLRTGGEDLEDGGLAIDPDVERGPGLAPGCRAQHLDAGARRRRRGLDDRVIQLHAPTLAATVRDSRRYWGRDPSSRSTWSWTSRAGRIPA
jgi:hypothetical protein